MNIINTEIINGITFHKVCLTSSSLLPTVSYWELPKIPKKEIITLRFKLRSFFLHTAIMINCGLLIVVSLNFCLAFIIIWIVHGCTWHYVWMLVTQLTLVCWRQMNWDSKPVWELWLELAMVCQDVWISSFFSSYVFWIQSCSCKNLADPVALSSWWRCLGTSSLPLSATCQFLSISTS